MKGKKRKFYFSQILTFVAAPWALFLWHWNQDILPVHTMLLQTGTSSLAHINASLIKPWPCAPKLPSPESKAFTASLRNIMSCKNQIRHWKMCIFFIGLNWNVFCHLKCEFLGLHHRTRKPVCFCLAKQMRLA